GPAEKGGELKPNDLISYVSQGDAEPVDVTNMPLHKVVRLIRGEIGTEVRLTVIKSRGAIPHVISIFREKIKLEDSAAWGEVKTIKLPNNKVKKLAYIYLPSFYADWEGLRNNDPNAKSTTRDVKKLIEKMQKEDNIEGLVLDLRGNGGGSLEESISLTGLFIPKGPVVQVRYPGRKATIRKDSDKGFAFDLPLVVMIDHNSASASEIFAGAIKDYSRGIIIGDKRTHGKGTVQQVLRLENMEQLKKMKPGAGALKFTMAKFYRISGHSTQIKGVVPDIIMDSFFDHMKMGEHLLPNALEWDEIDKLSYEVTFASTSKYTARVKANSAKRLEKNAEWQKLKKQIALFAERKSMKNLSLNKDARIKLRAEDKKWSKVTTAVVFRDRSKPKNKTVVDKDKNKDEDEEEELEIPDFMNIEAFFILADLIHYIKTDKAAK
ncbi:MAG: carboxy terminal-processing peptidase, partial [Lentisphaeria bacterium]|nr:carboxy terminal-processing peptidase [Lentisphaeria bacterium]